MPLLPKEISMANIDTLVDVNFDPALQGAVKAHSSGMILIGTHQGHGRTTVARATAASAIAAHGDDVAIVSRDPHPSQPIAGAATTHHILVATEGDTAEADALQVAGSTPGVRTIIYDAIPQISGVAYACALARSGRLVIITMPVNDDAVLIEAAVNSQTIACHPDKMGAAVLGAEDIAEVLIAVATQTRTPGRFHTHARVIDDLERLRLVSEYTHLRDTLGFPFPT